jgi:hypothetical protein
MRRDVELHPDERDKPWGPALEAIAGEALAITEQRMGVALDLPPLIRSLAPESAFYAELGRRPHRIVAVALAERNAVIINRGPYLQHGRYGRRQVLIHEFAHLILGRMVPSSIPRWLDEGLAMLVSGEQSLNRSLRVAMAASFGGLVPLDELWGSAEAGVIDQDLAYAESLAATRFFLESGAWGPYGPNDGLPEFVRKLAHPEHGRALRELLNDPGFLRAFERRWRESLRTFWTWAAALTSGGVFWVSVSSLFLLAYWRKRRMAEKVEAQWEAEEDAGYSACAPEDVDEELLDLEDEDGQPYQDDWDDGEEPPKEPGPPGGRPFRRPNPYRRRR